LTLSEHPNARKLRLVYESFSNGDPGPLGDLLSDNIRWVEPGRNQLTGTYEGRQAVFGLFGKVFELTGGSYRVEARKVFADDTDAVVIAVESAERGDKRFEMVSVQLERFEGDKVVEAREVAGDVYALDDFFN
jgi:uncharacterized protein